MAWTERRTDGMGTTRETLRAATHARHCALEDAIHACRYFADPARYADWLALTYRTLERYGETSDRAVLRFGLPPVMATLRGALLADLAAAGGMEGGSPTAATTTKPDTSNAAAPTAHAAPSQPSGAGPTAPEAISAPCADVASELGIAYVLEGSGLGARVLLTRVPAGSPARYLTRHAGLPRDRWPRLVAGFDAALGGDTALLACAAEAANGVFAAIHSEVSAR